MKWQHSRNWKPITRTSASSTTSGACPRPGWRRPDRLPGISSARINMGAPDPGEQEIDDFVGDDFEAAHPERYGGIA